MPRRSAKAVWQGTLKKGGGTVELGSGYFRGEYSFASRFQSGDGTNPEELIGAAYAACFSMALAGQLERAGHAPESIETTAKVAIEKDQDGFTITHIDLDTRGKVPGMDKSMFLEQAEIAKNTCPVSKVLAGATISLKAKLVT
jgi:osmotically inducible protein OsmC